MRAEDPHSYFHDLKEGLRRKGPKKVVKETAIHLGGFFIGASILGFLTTEVINTFTNVPTTIPDLLVNTLGFGGLGAIVGIGAAVDHFRDVGRYPWHT